MYRIVYINLHTHTRTHTHTRDWNDEENGIRNICICTQSVWARFLHTSHINWSRSGTLRQKAPNTTNDRQHTTFAFYNHYHLISIVCEHRVAHMRLPHPIPNQYTANIFWSKIRTLTKIRKKKISSTLEQIQARLLTYTHVCQYLHLLFGFLFRSFSLSLRPNFIFHIFLNLILFFNLG